MFLILNDIYLINIIDNWLFCFDINYVLKIEFIGCCYRILIVLGLGFLDFVVGVFILGWIEFLNKVKKLFLWYKKINRWD